MLLTCSPLAAQGFLPDAPVKGFELPWFDPKSNFLSMKLLGKEGLLKADNSVSIEGMTIHFYAPEKGEQPQTVITSPHADVFPSKALARGAASLQVVADQFSLSGEDWEWHWKENRLLIRDNVQLNIRQTLGPILQ